MFASEGRTAIWRLPVLRHFQTQAVVDVVVFDQCSFGLEEYRGSTRLLGINTQALRTLTEAAPNKGFCSHGGRQPKVCKDDEGEWRTAAKRAYPPHWCTLLAEVILQPQAARVRAIVSR